MFPSAASRIVVFTLATLVLGVGTAVSVARASDLADSPLTATRPFADLGDVYFFLDPNDNGFVVLAATLGGLIPPALNAALGFFDPKLALRFEIENTGDAKADETITVKFGPRTSPTVPQTATVKTPAGTFQASTTISRSAFGPQGSPTFGGGTSAQQTPTVTTHLPSGISFFAGLVDDPFFFDAAAFEAYRSSRSANQVNPAILTRGRDSFAGYNTLAVVLRVPVALVKGGDNFIGLAVSAKASGVKDRAAYPFVNTLMIPIDRRVQRGIDVAGRQGEVLRRHHGDPDRHADPSVGRGTHRGPRRRRRRHLAVGRLGDEYRYRRRNESGCRVSERSPAE